MPYQCLRRVDGRPTVVFPEATLTFRALEPLTISAERAPHAFQQVTRQDYEPKQLQRRVVSPPTQYPPPPYYSGYYWPYSRSSTDRASSPILAPCSFTVGASAGTGEGDRFFG